MSKTVLMDALHMQFRVRDDLAEKQCRAIIRALKSSRFHKSLRASITTAVRSFRSLVGVRIQITR